MADRDAIRVQNLDDAIGALRVWNVDPNPELAPGLRFAIGVLLSERDHHDNTETGDTRG